MINKRTKSFALDELTIELIQDLKQHFNLKSDSEVVTYALFDLALDKNVNNIKLHIEQDIARRKYYKTVDNSFNTLKKSK